MRVIVVLLTLLLPAASAAEEAAQLGPRPFYLVDSLKPGPLKERLAACGVDRSYVAKRFSISHRGAPLMFPEHTREGILAAYRMGAGIIECDVAFTKDRQLVCRHSQCDLHTTTDILAPARDGGQMHEGLRAGRSGHGAEGLGQVLHQRPDARRVQVPQRKDGCGRPRRHHGVGLHERDAALAHRPLRHHRHADVAQGVHRAGQVARAQVHAGAEGAAGADAVRGHLHPGPVRAAAHRRVPRGRHTALGRVPAELPAPRHPVLAGEGSRVRPAGRVPRRPRRARQGLRSREARDVEARHGGAGGQRRADPRAAALDARAPLARRRHRALDLRAGGEEGRLALIAWSLERSGPLKGGGGYYYQSVKPVVGGDGDALALLDVLHGQVGVVGVFSDWPATTTFYANCVGTP